MIQVGSSQDLAQNISVMRAHVLFVLKQVGLGFCYLGQKSSVSYKLALSQGVCHLPLRRVNPVLLQLLTFNMP